uniref:Uncharacterized protein n=1 Tax=Arundo donax TaxID=35708 RepID=A0A0A9AME4_ARUDO
MPYDFLTQTPSIKDLFYHQKSVLFPRYPLCMDAPISQYQISQH